jgi:hypothetical protein
MANKPMTGFIAIIVLIVIFAGISAREGRLNKGVEKRQWFDYIDLKYIFRKRN